MEIREEFIKLYKANRKNAIEFKNLNMPKKLYRYRSLTNKTINTYRYNELVHGKLFLSHPKDLNDLFEVTSGFCNGNIELLRRLKPIVFEAVRRILTQEEYEFVNAGEDWFERLCWLSKMSKNGEYEKITETINVTINELQEYINNHISDISKNLYRIASFSESPDNIPMWYHYTDNHKGVCLEYDKNSIDDLDHIFPAIYTKELPDVTGVMFGNQNFYSVNIFEYLAFHKAHDWRYENEWRMIMYPRYIYDKRDDVPLDFYDKGVQIDFVKPSKVILGIRISQKHKKIILKMCNKAGIPVVQARDNHFSLDVESEILN